MNTLWLKKGEILPCAVGLFLAIAKAMPPKRTFAQNKISLFLTSKIFIRHDLEKAIAIKVVEKVVSENTDSGRENQFIKIKAS